MKIYNKILFACIALFSVITASAQTDSDVFDDGTFVYVGRYNRNYSGFYYQAGVLGLVNPDQAIHNMVIPSEVTNNGQTYVVSHIFNEAFAGNEKISGEVKLPKYITGANLGSVIYKGETKSAGNPIGSAAFKGCTNITSITVGFYGSYSFGLGGNPGAFEGCTSLEEIVFYVDGAVAGTVTNGTRHFTGCNNIKRVVVVGNSVPAFANTTFLSEFYNSATLYVPNAMKSDFANTSYMWSKFTKVEDAESLIAVKSVDPAEVTTQVGAAATQLTANMGPYWLDYWYSADQIADEQAKVKWSSSDTKVATVGSSSGKVTPKDAGQTTVTASYSYGTSYPTSTATSLVTVEPKMINVSIRYNAKTGTGLTFKIKSTDKVDFYIMPYDQYSFSYIDKYKADTSNAATGSALVRIETSSQPEGHHYDVTTGHYYEDAPVGTDHVLYHVNSPMDKNNASSNEPSTGVEDVENASPVTVIVHGHTVEVVGAETDAVVKVYTVAGALVHSGTVKTFNIDVPGVYVVTVGETSTKVAVH